MDKRKWRPLTSDEKSEIDGLMAAESPPVDLAKLYSMGAFVDVTPGMETISKFCSDVEQGKAPDQQTIELIARALKPLSCPLSETDTLREALDSFAREVGLTKKQGRQPKGVGYLDEMALPVVFYFQQLRSLTESGIPKTAARIKARNRASEWYASHPNGKRLSDKALRDRISKFGKWAQDTLDQIDYINSWQDLE